MPKRSRTARQPADAPSPSPVAAKVWSSTAFGMTTIFLVGSPRSSRRAAPFISDTATKRSISLDWSARSSRTRSGCGATGALWIVQTTVGTPASRAAQTAQRPPV